MAPIIWQTKNDCTLLAFLNTILCMCMYITICDTFHAGETIGMRAVGIICVIGKGNHTNMIFHGITKTIFLVIFVYPIIYLILKGKTPYDEMFGISVQIRS